MDIDTIRALLRKGLYQTTEEFETRLENREFTFAQVTETIERGCIVDERPNKIPFPTCTIEAPVLRQVNILSLVDRLHLAVAVGPLLVLMTGYWPGDRPRRKGRKQ